MQTTEFRVSGMTGSFSDDLIQKSLKKLDGVVYAMASFSDGVVKVQHKGVGRQAMVDAIKEAGYNVTE
jgi:copper chaperone CopZ